MPTIRVNRAPVLTLWAAVVAQRLGYDRETALTLGKAVAGLNAVAKGRRLGVLHEKAEKPEKRRARATAAVKRVELLGRRIATVRTKAGLRAVRDGTPESPAAVERYLASRFGDSLPSVRAALGALAKSVSKDELADRAYDLYEKFRPAVPAGQKGWGAKGVLDLARLKKLAGS